MINELKSKLSNFKPYINGHKNMKKASVFIPIVKKDDVRYILFQVRAKHLNTSPSEISFPGGKIELNESPIDACIRETCEELGTSSDNICIISPLDLVVTHTNLIVHPYIGYINSIDNLNINKDEVDHIFLVPINYLLKYDPDYYKNEVKTIPDKEFPYDIIPNKENYKFDSGNYPVLFYEYKDYVIWGLTARILENFLNIIVD